MSDNSTSGFRLSPQQKRLWLLQSISPDSFFAQSALSISGALLSSRLRSALDYLVERHEILRTRFVKPLGFKLPVQLVEDDRFLFWSERELSPSESDSLDQSIEALFAKERAAASQEGDHRLRATLLRASADHHIVMLTLPGLCADGEAMRLMVKELAAAYGGNEEATEEEVAQYADLAEIFNEFLEGDDSAHGRDYWLKKDCSAIDRMKFPFAEDLKGRFDYLPKYFKREVSPEVTRKIEMVISERGLSMEAFLLACWQTLLGRLNAGDGLVTGVACDGRANEEIAGALGNLTRHLPLVFSPEGDLRFCDLAKQTNDWLASISEWQEYFDPCCIAQKEENENLSFYPVGFEYENGDATAHSEGISFSLIAQFTHLERFALKLCCARRSGDLLTGFHYDANLIREGEIEHLGDRFHSLLESAAERPDARLTDMNILSDLERRRLLIEMNQTRDDDPLICVTELFEREAAHSPQNRAVVCDDQEMTFGELNGRANRIAHFLRKRGVGPDSLVGLCLDRSPEMLAGLLGILKAGGAYVPFDPTAPKARLADQLARMPLRALVTASKFLSDIEGFAGDVLCVDGDRSLLDGESESNPPRQIDLQHLAYVIFTSGSTGVQKGVAITHENLANYTRFIQKRLGAGQSSEKAQWNFATVSTIAADLGNTAIFPSLVSGGCAHILSYETVTDANRFAAYAARHRIDALKIVPSHLNALISAGEAKEMLPKRYLILGGEAFSISLLDRIRKLSPDCEVINHYGPTETTVGSLTFDLKGFESGSTATVPIGRPIVNTEAYVLDGSFNPVPIGMPGELFIGGAGLARCYLNDPRQTAEKFVPNPFPEAISSRLYRTGDLARCLPGGDIEFLDRIDQQVKIRGFRIELGEVEAALKKHSGVRDCAVMARGDWSGEKRLIAYIAPTRQTDSIIQDLRLHLKETLPDYMSPSAFVLMKALPLTPNGKLDRKALPAPDRTRPELEGDYAAPRTEAETALARIWSEALDLERVGIHDNFFELGGDSILSIQIAARANQAELKFTPMQLFRNPTIARLCEAIGEGESGVERQPVSEMPLPLAPGQRQMLSKQEREPGLSARMDSIRLMTDADAEIEDIYPLSPMQQGMLFHNLYNPEAGMYLSQLSCAFENLNVSAFEQAWQQVVNRHAIFRTAFIWEGLDEAAQSVFREVTLPTERQDWRDIEPAKQQERLVAYLQAERNRGFDFRQAPLMRISHLRLSDDSHQFVWTYHHMLLDAWSEALVITEVMNFYRAICRNESLQMEPCRPYGDYIAWLTKQDLSEAERFWRRALRGFSSPTRLRLAKTSESDSEMEDGCAEHRVLLSKQMTSALTGLARQRRLTLSAIVQGAWALLLMHYSDTRDVVFGINVSGRPASLPGVETIIGIFINTLPMRLSAARGSSLASVLEELQYHQAELRQYEYSPLAQVQTWSEVPRGQSLFESILVFQNAPIPAAARARQKDDLQIRDVRFQGGWTNYPLALDVKPADEMILNLSYDRRRYDGSAARQLLTGMESLLRTFVERPDIEVEEMFKHLTEFEKQQRIDRAREMETANTGRLKLVRRKAIPTAAAN